ncbi:MAG: biopolymer transporter ExbB [Maritimibacter sp.]|jgi:hypothetical protein
MDQPDRGVEPNFTQPVRQILLILVTLTLVGVGVYLALQRVLPVFLSNVYLNGVILFVFGTGLVATLWQVVQVARAVGWIRAYMNTPQTVNIHRLPRLLAPMSGFLRERSAHLQIGTSSARSILDSVATRIDEERDITRYITNLLIFLGLLGTFYGLATTIPAVVDTIRSLAPGEGDSGVDVFNRLMTGLESQLGGMGTAFSSSLLGLAGSLVVGLLELFATHGQNRFYRELEEWLASITRFGFGPSGDADTDAVGPWLAYMSEQLDAMRLAFVQADARNAQMDGRLSQVVGAIDGLATEISNSNRREDGTPYLERIAEGQEALVSALMDNRSEEGGGGAYGDAESRMRLRSIDVQLLRILEEMSAGRQESLSELRGELAALTKALNQVNSGGQS